ncbi:MAG: hypothetical protein C0401_04855 [Anaerolinea sp.]|nr:hypothetical protein [Anaerolinea sp.]
MPAIEFTRLRAKIELLGHVYNQPGQFIKDLTEFYSSYADLTFQSYKTEPASTSLPAYRTPAVLSRELEHAFKPRARSDPETTLTVVDMIWQTNYLEPRQLAAALLGALPISFSSQVLERIRIWSSAGENRELVAMLHAKGTEMLRKEQPELWLDTLREWIQTKEFTLQKQAVSGLIPLVNDPDFNNFPIIFDFLQPLLVDPDAHLTYSLLTVIEKLAARSEMETVFFLKQVIAASNGSNLPRFIRRSLDIFQVASQNSIKAFLKENKNN